MILQFPSQDVLRLAMQAGLIPETTQIAPAKLLIDAPALFVDASLKLAKKAGQDLKELGVKAQRRKPKGEWVDVHCWAQMLALEVAPDSLRELEQSTVLFRLPTGEPLTTLVGEMLRLGNDRQSFRVLESQGESIALLRVSEPPYYSLLRALDPELAEDPDESDRVAAVTAYQEQTSRVWVKLGYQHVRPEALQPPPGMLLLIDTPRKWEFVEEGQFRDIYQALELALPAPSESWQPSEATEPKFTVPLRLTAGDTLDSNSFWVVSEKSMQQIEQLVASSDEQLLSRLSFAVVESKDTSAEPIVILRTRPSRLPPPVLVLDCVAYRPYLNLPNLFLPNGFRLHPPLRRDAVSKLLAADKQQVTWLSPSEDLSFLPMSVPENAFRPLSDWVEYVLSHSHEPLAAWMGAHQFDFEKFVCAQDKPSRSKPLLERPERRSSPASKVAEDGGGFKASERSKKKKSSGKKSSGAEYHSSANVRKEKPKVQLDREKTLVQLRASEQQFLAMESAIDSEERCTLWQELGGLNAALGNRADTSLCFSNVLWHNAPETEADRLQAWLQLEMQSRGLSSFGLKDLDAVLSKNAEQQREASLVAAFLALNLSENTLISELQERIGKLASLFESSERYLPIRVVWLAALSMHQLSDGDTLGLARTRDRLLDRLFQRGLQLEFDVPAFLRGRGSTAGGNDRSELLERRGKELFDGMLNWIDEKEAKARTRGYAEMMILFVNAAKDEEKTKESLEAFFAESEQQQWDDIHQWLMAAFRFRIEQRFDEDSTEATLPGKMHDELERLPKMDRYKVDKFRKFSKILEPHERIDPYRRYHRRYDDSLHQRLSELAEEMDIEQLREKVQSLLDEYGGTDQEPRVLAKGLELGPRLGQDLGLDIAKKTIPVLEYATDSIEKVMLLQRAIYLCAHFGFTDLTQDFVRMLTDELPGIVKDYMSLGLTVEGAKERMDSVESLLVQSFRGLRKLGMRDEIGELYAQVAELVQANQKTKPKDARVAEQQEARSFRLLLCVASGWYYFGNHEAGNKITSDVRKMLFKGKLKPIEQCRLAEAYVNALGQAPASHLIDCIFELFAMNAGDRKLQGITDNASTKSHFSTSQLSFIEACLLALFNQEQKLSPEAQRMLDEDEFLVRKKIHQDMRELV